MKTKSIPLKLVSCLLIVVLFVQCKEDPVIIADKKVTLELFNDPIGISYYMPGGQTLTTPQTSFSISDYYNLDSISFVISGFSLYKLDGTLKTADTIYVELIDLNTDLPIEKSLIKTFSMEGSEFIATENLLESFAPNQSYNLGINVWHKTSGSLTIKQASIVMVRDQFGDD